MAGEQEVDDRAIAAARSKVGAGARATLDTVRRFAQRAGALLGAPLALRESARQQVEILDAEAVAARLRQKPLGSLKDVAGRGVRLNQLERAGFSTVADVLAAESYQLHNVPGVGPQTVYQVVEAARLAAVQVHHDTRFRFDPDHPDPGQTRLLATLAAIRAADGTAATLREPLQNFTARTVPLAEEAERAGSRLRMFFAGRSTKNAALHALARLDALLAEPAAHALQQTVAQRESTVDPRSYPPDQLWHGYRTDAASVNAVLRPWAHAGGPTRGRQLGGSSPRSCTSRLPPSRWTRACSRRHCVAIRSSERSTRSTRSGRSSVMRWGSARRCRRSPCSRTWQREASVVSWWSVPPAFRSTGLTRPPSTAA